ncbi:10319_t:CDS:2 [Dentiscutata heterogama]|uniref:10319_t:CDS:1 n=1 Tax=Dentiscutata heterogama TaxID=1316150 RepID=A0ACA9M388_9GLOM|nr:10319_t:CDS:2 [Dentiscutata heterogama]
MTLPTLPDELKFINGFLQRAQELRNREPVIAYYCNFYSVKLALERGTKSKESKAFLARLLDVLEEEKKALHDNEAAVNNLVGEAYVENFGLKVFMNADNEDRAGKATKKTAKNFLAAAVFLELLKVFGPLNSEIEEKIRYAKWKATDIVKALKEGQVPTPGPPGGEPALQQPPREDYVNPSDNFPSVDQFPSAPLVVDSPSGSHIEENGRQPMPGFTNDSLHPSGSHIEENGRQPIPGFTNDSLRLSGSLMEESGRQLIPGLTNDSLRPSGSHMEESSRQPIPGFTNDSLRHQPSPSFPSNPPPLPPSIPGYTNDTLRHQPPSSFSSNPPPPPLPPSIPGFTNDTLHHQPPSSFPGNPPPRPQNYAQPYSSPTYQPTTPSSLPTNPQHVRPYTQLAHHFTEIDPNIVATAQKHCKWAISALNYNDIPTAIENMRKALAMLEPYNH